MNYISEILDNIAIGALILVGIVLFMIVGVLIELYADWLNFIWFGVFMLVSYEIGRYIRKK